MHRIEVDDDVFAQLQQLAEPLVDTPNTVIRRLLAQNAGLAIENTPPPLPKPRKRYRNRRTGELMPLLTAGVLLTDDTLVYAKRNGEVHRGVVTNDGWIEVDGKTYPSPSGALKASVGYDVNGWKLWMHERTGNPLASFRE